MTTRKQGENNQVDEGKTTSRSALRRLIIVVAVVGAILLYAFGWEMTEISLDETRDPVRQESVGRALRELLSPDIFDQDRESQNLTTSVFIGDCDDFAAGESQLPADGEPYVVYEPACGEAESVVMVSGRNFQPNAVGQLRLVRSSGQKQPLDEATADGVATGDTIFDIDSNGEFQTYVMLPRGRGSTGQTEVEFFANWPVGTPYLSDTSILVLEKITETIFLALMATTLAIPIAIALSFLAALNLMRSIHMLLGGVLLGTVLFPVGWLVSSIVLGPVANYGAEWGEGIYLGIIGIIVAGGLFIALSRTMSQIDAVGNNAKIIDVIMNLALLIVVVFVGAVVGGMSVRVGNAMLENDVVMVQYIGNMLGTIGELIVGLIALLGALGGALTFAFMGMRFAGPFLRHLTGTSSQLVAGLLGVGAGAAILVGVAVLGNLAALMTLLTPVVVAIMTGSIAVAAFAKITGDGLEPGQSKNNVARTFLLIIGAVLGFVVTFSVLDLNRSIVLGLLPSTEAFSIGAISIQLYLVKAGLIGAILGGIGAGIVGTNASFPMGLVIYNVTRTTLNILRSIEPLIMGIVFVIWVGIGPFAGVLALTLHSVAALGKLYSEQIESIDSGPLEAITASGANRLQMIVYAVVPQIVPPYIAFTMYRWDINVRMSTIIGFVGGGGIGFLLSQQINLLRYRQAGVAVLAIAVVVSVLDYTSATIRERLI